MTLQFKGGDGRGAPPRQFGQRFKDKQVDQIQVCYQLYLREVNDEAGV
ncbi:hypothetical protein AO056_04023 [Aeromonas hydrophila]|nr:hypothetical protein AO056_04023 [Aeromonas hydrophila]